MLNPLYILGEVLFFRLSSVGLKENKEWLSIYLCIFLSSHKNIQRNSSILEYVSPKIKQQKMERNVNKSIYIPEFFLIQF